MNPVITELARVTKLSKKQVKELIEKPPSKLGDLAFPCFTLSKQYKKDPKSIAEEITSKIKTKGLIKEVRAIGPYVNIFYNQDEFANKVIKRLELIKKTVKKKIMVEFFHPNTHKGVHIGHARNLFTGESISRILEEKGVNVVRVTYGGDIGPHVAKCLWGYMNLGLKPTGDKGEWLGKIYAKANNKSTNNKSLQEEIRDINKKLYSGNKKLLNLLDKTKQWSIDHIKKMAQLSNTKFDAYIWESQVEKQGLKIAKQLTKKGVLKESQGAIIADLEKYKLGIMVIVTKDGTPLYPAKDLGLVKYEFEKFKVDKIIHVVGTEQSFYFQQLFKVFELAGWSEWAENSIHRAYELVGLRQGKMSSRLGNVVLFRELYDKMLELAKKELKERYNKVTESLAHEVTISALKFGMLNHDLNKKILFDYKEWLSFEGNTGPYIQYSFVRANKILKKAGEVKASKIRIEKEQEYELVKKLNDFNKEFKEAYNKLDPSLIAHYALSLANAFNKFYEHCPVINSELKNSRIQIVKAFVKVMSRVIHLLGLKPMKKM